MRVFQLRVFTRQTSLATRQSVLEHRQTMSDIRRSSMNRSFRSATYVAALSFIAFGCGREASPPAQTPETSTPMNSMQPMAGEQQSAAMETGQAPAMQPAAGTRESAAATASDTTAQRATMGDDQIAAITDAANTAEVEQARIALTKTKNARVKKFANMMIAHHGKAKEDQTKLQLGTRESATLTELSADSTNQLSLLKNAGTKDFDRTYIDAQVEAHRKVLNLFDTALIPNATNTQLKQMLMDFRPRIAEHLTEAQQIQEMLTAQGSSTTTTTEPSTGAASPSQSTSPSGTTGSGDSANSGARGTGSGTNANTGTTGSGSTAPAKPK
jgi:putative membrane protein